MSDFVTLYKFTNNRYENTPCYFTRPQRISIMETNGSQLNMRNPSIKYFQQPSLEYYPIDLNKGHEQHILKQNDFFDNNVSRIEKFLMIEGEPTNNSRSDTASAALTKVYTKRGLLVKLMMTPYMLHPGECNKFNILVCKFKNRLFLNFFKTKKEVEMHSTPWDAYHFKFEQHVFVAAPNQQPNIEEATNSNSQRLYCLMQTQLRNFDIVYSCEVSGIKSENIISDITNVQQLNACHFIMAHVMLDAKPWQKTFKAFKTWCQAYLSNSTEICIGIRDSAGIIKDAVQMVPTKDIPKQQFWQPHLSIAFVNEFLCLVQDKMCSVDCPYTVYEFEFQGVNKEIRYKIHEGKTDKSFLSENFIDFMWKKY